MKAHFIFNTDKGQVCTYKNSFVDFADSTQFQRKRNILIFPKVINENSCYKYKVKAEKDTLYLIVLKGSFKEEFIWEEIYWASINKKFIFSEHGDCDIEFWHEYFASYNYNRKNEYDIRYFCENNDMEEVRKIFPVCMQQNAFIVFEKYKRNKKPDIKFFPTEWFKDIPQMKINKNVGKALDNNEKDQELRHFCWQKEINIHNEVFFDVNVISGYVKNGIMDIKEKHRFFISEDFCYSPDGGDAGILISEKTYGLFYFNNMAKKYPLLMLNKYTGKYFYAYFFAKHFLPIFEITAKAGLSNLADVILAEYFKNCNKNIWYSPISDELCDFNLYGKNDKDIFKIKLNKIRFLNDLDFSYNKYNIHNTHLNYAYRQIKEIYLINPSALDFITCSELLEFAWLRQDDKDLVKEILYLKHIGYVNYKIYNDYLNLCQQAKRSSGGKYPLNLKFHHDVMTNFMKEVREAIQNEGFKEKVNDEDYQKNIFIDNEYAILAPRVANDLVNESYNLSHCVRSYISDVALGRTMIYFMRKTSQKGKSLITIEVRNGKIIQARGKNNRTLDNNENKFMNLWANKKGLINCV